MPGDFVAVNQLGDKRDIRFGFALLVFGIDPYANNHGQAALAPVYALT